MSSSDLVTSFPQERVAFASDIRPFVVRGRGSDRGGRRGRGGRGRSSLTDSHYGFLGHDSDHCYRLHDYPTGYQPRFATSSHAAATDSRGTSIGDMSSLQSQVAELFLSYELCVSQPPTDCPGPSASAFEPPGAYYEEDCW